MSRKPKQGQTFNALMQVRYGRAEHRTALGPFNASIDPGRKILSPPDLEWHRRTYTRPMLSQQQLGEIRWERAVRASRARRGEPSAD